ncbi:hypothetical protein BKM15_25955 [Pseudomonas syringae pv. syringae]|nr:hypothetical protein BKM15_25955 [Pseudomonas syringae pv. syringae]
MAADGFEFGLADITVGEGVDAVVFDGVNFFQAEGGEGSLEPIFEDITIADFGGSIYNRIFTGLNGTVTVRAANRTLKMLNQVLGWTDTITDTTTSTIVGIMDTKIGTSMRERAKKVTIHPRNLPTTDKSQDIVIYKMGAEGSYDFAFGNELRTNELTFTMYPRDGLDVKKPGNFFYIGPKDPNATT